MHRTTLVVTLAVLSSRAWGAQAVPTTQPVERSGPLAALPSPPGDHIARIKALGDNEWLKLGPPAADPKWGRARGRSWTFSMPLAPELRGAFLYGTGVHGYVKPDGHYMDDLFFYDVNAHRWICCYPGLDLKPEAPELKIDQNGWERDASGQPIPVITGHAWGHVTYDTDRRMFVFAREGGTPYPSLMAKRGKWWSAEIARNAKPHSPWAWNTRTGQWECEAIETPHPSYGNGDTFLYVPTRRQYFHAGRLTHADGRVHFYDPAAKKWTRFEPKGPRPPATYDATSCYDPKRDRIYIGGGGAKDDLPQSLWAFDLKTDAWVDPKPEGTPITQFSTNQATMQYDSANDVVIVCAYNSHPVRGYKQGVRGLHVYDPAANRWLPGPKALPAEFSPGPGASLAAGFYDPELNAHFFHVAGDSRDNGVMWVYRYRPGSTR